MKQIRLFSLFLMFAAIFSACSDDEPGTDLPQSITNFVERYYPFLKYSAEAVASGGYIVEIENSATLTFNSDEAWTDINGNGEVLGEMLLYDQLPERLYDYLEETENIQGVYRISRNMKIYTVQLLDSTVTYNENDNQFINPN